MSEIFLKTLLLGNIPSLKDNVTYLGQYVFAYISAMFFIVFTGFI